MKKFLFAIALMAGTAISASAQLLPSFQFGIKGGVNLTDFSTSASTALSSNNRAGYLAGFWARVGGAGINFQPELYITSKDVDLTANNVTHTAKYTSIDLPLLIGTKFGVLGNGIRINTGPVISFAVNKDQSTGQAFSSATHLDYKDQNYAWQFGVGADVRRLSLDLRYEAGINKINNDNGDKARINLFNLTLGYRLFSL